MLFLTHEQCDFWVSIVLFLSLQNLMMLREAYPSFSVLFILVLCLLFILSGYPGSHFACSVSPKTFTGEGLRMYYIPCIWSMQLSRGIKCVGISSALGMPFNWGDPGWPSYGKWYNIKSTRPWKWAAWICTQALWLTGCVTLGNYSPSLSNFYICNMWKGTVLHSTGLSIRWDTVTKVHSFVFGTQ